MMRGMMRNAFVVTDAMVMMRPRQRGTRAGHDSNRARQERRTTFYKSHQIILLVDPCERLSPKHAIAFSKLEGRLNRVSFLIAGRIFRAVMPESAARRAALPQFCAMSNIFYVGARRQITDADTKNCGCYCRAIHASDAGQSFYKFSERESGGTVFPPGKSVTRYGVPNKKRMPNVRRALGTAAMHDVRHPGRAGA